MSPEQVSTHEVWINTKRKIEATVRKAAKTSPYGLLWRIKINQEASVNLITLLERDAIADRGEAISHLPFLSMMSETVASRKLVSYKRAIKDMKNDEESSYQGRAKS